MNRTDPENTLEVHGEVEQENDVAAHEEELVSGAGRERRRLVKSGHHHGVFAQPDLPANQSDNNQAKSNKQANDHAAVPGMAVAAILKGKNEAGDTTHGQSNADRVKIQKLDFQRSILGLGQIRELEEEEDDNSGKSTNGQVDIEAPSPSSLVGEDTAEDGT